MSDDATGDSATGDTDADSAELDTQTLAEHTLDRLDARLDRDSLVADCLVLVNREDSRRYDTGERVDSLDLKRNTPIGVARTDRDEEYAGAGGRHRFATDGIVIRVEGLDAERGGCVPGSAAMKQLTDAIVDILTDKPVRDNPPDPFHAFEAPDTTRRLADSRDYYRTDIEVGVRGYPRS